MANVPGERIPIGRDGWKKTPLAPVVEPSPAPPNRVVVKYYFPEDASKAEKIRRALSRVLIKMEVEISKQLGPAQSYRPGHIDIWLPQKAVDLLRKIPMPASAQ